MKIRLCTLILVLITLVQSVAAQTGAIPPWYAPVFLRANGTAPLANGFVCTYAAGTTDPLSTYSTPDLMTPNSNPITLDAAGRPVSGSTPIRIYLAAASYKFVTYTSAPIGNTCNGVDVGAQVQSIDDVYDLAQLFTTSFATKFDDKVCHASQFSGADAGVKIRACATALPTTGGTIDARGLEGPQSWGINVLGGFTKPIVLIIGMSTITVSENQTIPLNVTFQVPIGGKFSVNSGKQMAFLGRLDAGPYQVFTGAGTERFNGTGITVYPEWWGALADSVTDSSTAFTNMIASIKTSGPSSVLVQPGTYLLTDIDFSGANGMAVHGSGGGQFDGTDAKTTFKYNGGGSTIILAATATSNLSFDNILFDGNSETGRCIWLKNSPSGNEALIQFHVTNFTITHCTAGFQVGGNSTGFVNNYNQIRFEQGNFYANTNSVLINNNNTEFFTFNNVLFAGDTTYYIQATAAAFINLNHVYFGAMGIGATGAVIGPIVPIWNDIRTELGAGFYTLAASATGSFNQNGSINGLFNASRGDSSNIAIYWSGDGKLAVTASTIVGQIQWDARRKENGVTLNGVTYTPVVDSEIVTLHADAGGIPLIAGIFNGSNSTYCPKTTGSTTFQWKISTTSCVSGSYSSNITIPAAGKARFSNGLIAEFPPGVSWANGSEWAYPVTKTGTIEQGGTIKPDPFYGVFATLHDPAAVYPMGIADNTQTIVKWDTANFDTFSQYDATTGTFTAMLRGFYRMSSQITWTGGIGDPPLIYDIGFYINGTLYKESFVNIPGATASSSGGITTTLSWTTNTISNAITDVLAYLNPGDTVVVKVLQHTEAAAAHTPITSFPDARHWMKIEKIAAPMSAEY